MKNRIISLLVSLLIVGCFVNTMAMDSKNSEKVPSFARFIPFKKYLKSWWPKTWWKYYICSHKLSAREWHTNQARREVEKPEHILQQKLDIPHIDPNNFYNFYFFLHNNRTISPLDVQFLANNFKELTNSEEGKQMGKELFDQDFSDVYNSFEWYEQPDVESKIREHIKKNYNNNLGDIPPIRVSKIVPGVRYFEYPNIVSVSEPCAIAIAHKKTEVLKRVACVIPHELVHKVKKHTSMINYYKLLARRWNRQDVDTILTKYKIMQEREADIVGCITGGPKMCREFKKFLELEQELLFKLSKPIDDDEHPPFEERVAYLGEVIKDMKKEDSGQCFNPDYETNDLPRFVNCDRYIKKRMFDFLKKCKSLAKT